MSETFASGVGKSIGPVLLLGGVLVVLYLWLKNKVPGSQLANELTTPLNVTHPTTGSTDSFWSWWTSGTKDYGTGPQDAAGPLSGDPNKSVIQVQIDRFVDWWTAGAGIAEQSPVSLTPADPAWVQAGLVSGGSSVSGLPAAPGSATAENLAVNAALFAQLPTSYEQIKQFDIKPGRGFLDFDYVKGDYAMQITPDSWHLLQYQKHSYGWEWTDIMSAGGSSPAVWHSNQFLSALQTVGITNWRA